MDILKRLVPGIAVIVAAILGYGYAVYVKDTIDSARPHVSIDAADPPAAAAPPPEPVAQCPASPSVGQLEQAAYIFSKGFDQLEQLAADVKAMRERLEKPPPGWTTVVAPATPKPRPAPVPVDHSWLGRVLK